jgi:glutamate racemase
MSANPPKILVFDSGVGGLTVLDPIRKARSDARYLYLADTEFFPYGEREEEELVARVLLVLEQAASRFNPDLIVIACHTASTLVLPTLRAQISIPIIGTVPAIKPAAETSQSRLISVLATKGTVKRDYTTALIRDFAGDCEVTLVSAARLAGFAEEVLHGETVSDKDLQAEIAPAFVEKNGRRTDRVVLACTHYPLLLAALQKLAPWPVTFIDPAPAIARRVVQVIGEAEPNAASNLSVKAYFTRLPPLSDSLRQAGLAFGIEKFAIFSVNPAPVV